MGVRQLRSSKWTLNKNKQNEKSGALKALHQSVAGPGSDTEKQVESDMISDKKIGTPVSKLQAELPLQDMREKSRECVVPSSKEGDEMEECNPSGAHASTAGASNGDIKLEFDLNEGLNTDDCKFVESTNFSTTTSSAVPVPLVSELPVTTSSSPASLSAPIAVKGQRPRALFAQLNPEKSSRHQQVQLILLMFLWGNRVTLHWISTLMLLMRGSTRMQLLRALLLRRSPGIISGGSLRRQIMKCLVLHLLVALGALDLI